MSRYYYENIDLDKAALLDSGAITVCKMVGNLKISKERGGVASITICCKERECKCVGLLSGMPTVAQAVTPQRR